MKNLVRNVRKDSVSRNHCKVLIKSVIIILSLTNWGILQAQFPVRLGRAVKNAAENAAVRKAEQKTTEAVNKAIDEATTPEETQKQTPSTQQNTQQNTQNSSSTSTTATPQKAASGTNEVEMVYAKSDFVPGDEVFFVDDLANEKLGEFPSQWDLDKGNAEIVSINGEKCISLIGYTVLMPLIEPAKKYLPDQFTIEYDVYADNSKNSSVCCEMGFNDSRTFVGRHYLRKDNISLSGSWVKPDGSSGSQNVNIPGNGGWHHISISFNKRALKYYVDGVRQLNVPNMKQPNSIWIWAEAGNAYYKNFRFAKGAVPLYDRLTSNGKIITYGITFDVGKATIKPESMGEINRIAQLMTENPELKFSVEGHTDNTGSAASNQTLSEERSKAVMAKLVEMGISKDRLSAAGKGQTAPIADNSTDEGRAKNRRVEFVKM
ncbi:MAG: OmpA family protein [Bacteroidales bacterium]|jgi:outer membrane protein OmpA-like peptidoglycan-associated protein|nr:OmpA family protein [Bacteroidales bacterium]